MKLDLNEHEVDVLLFDLPKLIDYYTDLLEQPPEDDEDGDPEFDRMMTRAHLDDLRSIKAKLSSRKKGGPKTKNEWLTKILGDVPPLTDDEFEAVYDWVTIHKDEWPALLKNGLLKLLNTEGHRRL